MKLFIEFEKRSALLRHGYDTYQIKEEYVQLLSELVGERNTNCYGPSLYVSEEDYYKILIKGHSFNEMVI